MRIFGILVMLCVLFTSSLSAGSEDFSAKADAFFSKYVQNDAVNYEAAGKSELLGDLVSCIAEQDLGALSDLEKQAFLVNAYNILVIKSVSENLPTESVMDLDKFFDKEGHIVAGDKVSLNTLEKKMLFKSFPDPLFHFVLVCGAVDCPPIAEYAYTADKLKQQLEERTRRAMNDPSFIKVSDGGIEISKIFEWYAQDFGANKTAIVEFINSYRDEPIGDNFSYYEYDWSLNGAEFDTGFITEKADNETVAAVPSTESPVKKK